MVKCLPTMRETWVQSLGWEDSLEKEMATHSSTLAWKIPWTEEHGSLQSAGLQRAGHFLSFFQCSPSHYYVMEMLLSHKLPSVLKPVFTSLHNTIVRFPWS